MKKDEGTPWLDYSEGITGTTTGSYTYYVIPKTNRGNIFLVVSNGGGGYFECEIGSVTVENVLAAFQPLYTAVLNNVTDYYAFGSPMPGRNVNSNTYRYGFNKGSEKDDEIYGNGNTVTTYYRELDTRLGKWWSVDPKADEMPWQSPYSSMDNTPIMLNDPKGDCVTCPTAVPITAYEVGVALVEAYEAYAAVGTLNAVMEAGNKKSTYSLDAILEEGYSMWEHASVETATAWKENNPLYYNAWTLYKYKGIAMKKGVEILEKAEAQKASAYEMSNKKGPKDLVGEAKDQKAKEQKSQERQGKREKASKEGQNKEGNSNKDTKGSHSGGKGGNKGNKHDAGNARRAADQGVKGPDLTK